MKIRIEIDGKHFEITQIQIDSKDEITLLDYYWRVEQTLGDSRLDHRLLIGDRVRLSEAFQLAIRTAIPDTGAI